MALTRWLTWYLVMSCSVLPKNCQKTLVFQHKPSTFMLIELACHKLLANSYFRIHEYDLTSTVTCYGTKNKISELLLNLLSCSMKKEKNDKREREVKEIGCCTFTCNHLNSSMVKGNLLLCGMYPLAYK